MPTAAIVAIVLVVIVGGLMVVGIIAAIAIPGLLRARMSANEASALATMRTMASAQTAWASAHDGRYAPASCLGAPAACGDSQAVSSLPPDIASLRQQAGYDFGLVLRRGANELVTEGAATDGTIAGATATATGDAPGVSPPGAPTDADVRRQLEAFSTPDMGATPAPAPPVAAPVDRGGFVFWASPSNPGVTGSRRFCVDETGLVRDYRVDTPWMPPSDAQPRCPETGAALP